MQIFGHSLLDPLMIRSARPNVSVAVLSESTEIVIAEFTLGPSGAHCQSHLQLGWNFLDVRMLSPEVLNPCSLVRFFTRPWKSLPLCWVPFWWGNLFWGKFLPQAPELKELQLDFQYFDPVTWFSSCGTTIFSTTKSLRDFFKRPKWKGFAFPQMLLWGPCASKALWDLEALEALIARVQASWSWSGKLEWRMRVGAVVAVVQPHAVVQPRSRGEFTRWLASHFPRCYFARGRHPFLSHLQACEGWSAGLCHFFKPQNMRNLLESWMVDFPPQHSLQIIPVPVLWKAARLNRPKSTNWSWTGVAWGMLGYAAFAMPWHTMCGTWPPSRARNVDRRKEATKALRS